MSSVKLKLSLITAATTLFLGVGQSNALTLKSGEVLGGDGKVWEGLGGLGRVCGGLERFGRVWGGLGGFGRI